MDKKEYEIPKGIECATREEFLREVRLANRANANYYESKELNAKSKKSDSLTFRETTSAFLSGMSVGLSIAALILNLLALLT